MVYQKAQTMSRSFFGGRRSPRLNLREDQVAFYTGDTDIEERERILEDLHKKRGKIRLLLATAAFGFGVDIGNLDFSVHAQVPDDLDRLYQEMSRCSREPMKGVAHVFYSPHEVAAATKRNMGTFRYETVRDYLEYLKIKKIKKKPRILNLKNVLKKSDKKFGNQHKAQMSANAFFDHAFEAIMFLFRHDLLELRPLRANHFPRKMSQLRAAFENGKVSGYRRIPYKGYKVVLPSVKFPVRITKNVTWPKIERLVNEDKVARGKRTERLKVIGRNSSCHWRTIAQHYGVPLRSVRRNGELVKACNFCNVCRA
jgi:superfamily II DNA/RNA helicase